VTEVVSQIFPTISQNAVDHHCRTTTKINQVKPLFVTISGYSDEVLAVSQNVLTVTKVKPWKTWSCIDLQWMAFLVL